MEVVGELKCAKCKTEASEEDLIKTSKSHRRDGSVKQIYWCRPCNAERFKRYYHNNKERVRAIIYKSIEKHKEKQKAREMLNWHVNSGKVKKPDTCENCNVKDIIQGHHPDYSKPLEVMWLCTPCHSRQHRLERMAN